MSTFFKVMTAAIDVLLAVALGMEIKNRLDARKNNKTNEALDEPEPATIE